MDQGPDQKSPAAQNQSTDAAVATMAELRGLWPAQYDYVLLKAYETPEDGGGGWFRWHATETGPQLSQGDDGGTIIKPNSLAAQAPGRWRRIYSGPLNVRWFGASADPNTGPSANRDAIQTAADAAQDGGLLFPPGVYSIQGRINIISAGAPSLAILQRSAKRPISWRFSI